MLGVGQLFTLVVYGQLILRAGRAHRPRRRCRSTQVFDFLVRDFSTHAVALHGKASATEAQQAWALGAIRKPAVDFGRFGRVWDQVAALDGAYRMPG